MNNNDVLDYLEMLATASGMVHTNLRGLCEKCLHMGLKDFWGASEWSFKTYEHNLAITTSVDDYALPQDFAGFVTVKEKDSLEGQELLYYPKAEFDRLVPNPTAYPSTYPQIFTVWYDKSQQLSYIRFYPMPEAGHTIVIEIVTRTPTNMGEIEERFVSGVIACAQKYLYPLGKAERLQAWAEAREEIKRLEIIDSPYQTKAYRFFDDTDTQITITRPWA